MGLGVEEGFVTMQKKKVGGWGLMSMSIGIYEGI
jgi:hypothetical protein